MAVLRVEVRYRTPYLGVQSKLSHKYFPCVSSPLVLCPPLQCPCVALGTHTWPGVPRSLRQSHREVEGSHRGSPVSSALCWEESDAQGGVSSVSIWDTPRHFLLCCPLHKLLDKVWKLHRNLPQPHLTQRALFILHTNLGLLHRHHTQSLSQQQQLPGCSGLLSVLAESSSGQGQPSPAPTLQINKGLWLSAGNDQSCVSWAALPP